MTLSKSKSVKSASVTKSHAKPASNSPVADSTTQLPAAPPVQAPPATIADAAKSAVSLIASAENILPLTFELTASARKTALRLQSVPSAAIAESARILQVEGHRYPDFDLQVATDAVDFEKSMTDVVSGATALIGKAKTAILNHRAPAAQQTLALYAVLKAHSRTDASLVEPTKRLEPLVNTRKNPHQTKKQREEAKAKAAAAASSSSATATAPSAEPPAAVTSGASAPPIVAAH